MEDPALAHELTLVRRYRFSASHLYRRPEWSEEQNAARFGKCSFEPGHGHNYRLWVWVEGEPAADTGFLVDLGELDRIVEERVVTPLDHRHLNAAIPEFSAGGKIPTSENLIEWIRRRLVGNLPAGCRLSKLRLEEDEDLAVEWAEAGA